MIVLLEVADLKKHTSDEDEDLRKHVFDENDFKIHVATKNIL